MKNIHKFKNLAPIVRKHMHISHYARVCFFYFVVISNFVFGGWLLLLFMNILGICNIYIYIY